MAMAIISSTSVNPLLCLRLATTVSPYHLSTANPAAIPARQPPLTVIPAKAGIQLFLFNFAYRIPARIRQYFEIYVTNFS
jgi:hypothetical protein